MYMDKMMREISKYPNGMVRFIIGITKMKVKEENIILLQSPLVNLY